MYEDVCVFDVVMMGYIEMWVVMIECDVIYVNLEVIDDDYMYVVEFEGKFVEYGGYDVEVCVGVLLFGIGIEEKFYNGMMVDVVLGWKLCVLFV